MVVVDGSLRSGRGNGVTMEVFFFFLLLWFVVVADGGSNSGLESSGLC